MNKLRAKFDCGFDVAKQMREISKDTYLIFITTESSLVYDSFDFQPFYFIPKGKPQVFEERLRHVAGKLALHTAANEKILIDGSFDNKFYVINIFSRVLTTGLSLI